MSINKLLALLATSVVTPAVIKLVAGLVGCNEPNVNCVILLKLPVGVVLVSAVALAAISVNTRIIGIESAPSHGFTSNHIQFNQIMAALKIGMPIKLYFSGNSMCATQSVLADLRLKMPVNAEMIIFGFANRLTMLAVTIMETPHHKHQLLVKCGRPKMAAAMSYVPSACTILDQFLATISPARIMRGANTRKFAAMPTNKLLAMRIPMSPPAPIMDKSKATVTPSCSKVAPRDFGSGTFPACASL